MRDCAPYLHRQTEQQGILLSITGTRSNSPECLLQVHAALQVLFRLCLGASPLHPLWQVACIRGLLNPVHVQQQVGSSQASSHKRDANCKGTCRWGGHSNNTCGVEQCAQHLLFCHSAAVKSTSQTLFCQLCPALVLLTSTEQPRQLQPHQTAQEDQHDGNKVAPSHSAHLQHAQHTTEHTSSQTVAQSARLHLCPDPW